MTDVAALVADNIHIWTGAIQRKSGSGRGGGKRISLHGIERLRALILDLAVRGKLVPQDAQDEPASELLKRIAKERSAKSQKVKAPKLKLNGDHVIGEKPHNPRGWVTVPLSEILLGNVGGGTPSKTDSRFWGGDIPWASVKDVGKSKYVSDTQDRITKLGLEKSSANLVPAGNIILVTRMGLGQLSISKIDLAINQDLRAIFISENVNIDYCYNFFLTHEFEGSGMTVKGVKLHDLLSAPFPLPPLAEQRRIVAKVDELMALCDSLERESAGAMAAHQALVEALLATLVNSADAADLARQWARLESHFDTLFTTDASIDALKQTILGLAVRGKLVEQDAGDEAAKLPSFRQVSVSSDWDGKVFQHGKGLFNLPAGWEIAPLAQVSSHIIDCPHTTPKWTDTGELCVRTNQIKPRHLDLSQPNFVSLATYQERIERLQPAEGDILYIREGGILGVGCRIPADVKLCLGQRSMLIRCHKAISSYYLEIAINSPFIVEQAAYWTTGGAAPRVNMSTVRGYPIPIPPLAEQRRIVAKVDALMALCDALKARLVDAAQTQRHLADAITQRAAA